MPRIPEDAEWLSKAQVCADVARDECSEADRLNRFPMRTVQSFRDSQLFGFMVPGEYGGNSGTIEEYSHIARIIGSSSLSAALIWSMHVQQVQTISLYGTEGLRRKVLPKVARGEVYIGSITTETGSGGTLFSSDLPVTYENDSVRIDRPAPVVTGGKHADGFLVKLRRSEDAGKRSTVLVYVPAESSNTSFGEPWHAMGMRSVENVSVNLSARVPAENTLETNFDQIATNSFAPMAHLGWASAWLGCARDAYMRVNEHLAQAENRHKLQSQAVLVQLGLIRQHLEIVSAYLRCTLLEIGEQDLRAVASSNAAQIHLNLLKTIASEHCYAAVDRMIDLVGLGPGYLATSKLDLERRFRDLRAARLLYSDQSLHQSVGSLGALDRATRLIGLDDPN